MAGTFGQQLQQQQAQQQQDQRTTRTQRINQETAQRNFEQYKREAERLRQEEFIDKQVQETYYIIVPRDYLDRHGNILPSWERMSERNQRNILNRTRESDKVKVTRTRTVNDPFTFEEYGQEYAKLDPNIQQFFLSPQQITDVQNTKKQEQRGILQSRIDEYQQRLVTANQRLQDYNNWWEGLSSKERERRRERHKEEQTDRERDIEEIRDALAFARGEAGKIDQGATAEDIWSYAQDKASYNRERKENRSEARQQFNKSIQTGTLDENLLKLGLSKDNVSLEKYADAVAKYNIQIQESNRKIAEQNKRAEKLEQAGGTTLKLGEKKKEEAVMSIDTREKLTAEQTRLNELYSNKGLIQKSLDWVKNAFGLNQEATPPKMEVITTTTAPIGMGGRGTAITTAGYTPEMNAYLNDIAYKVPKLNQIAEETFQNYEKKISELKTEDITREKVSAIKVEEQTNFNSKFDAISSEASKIYKEQTKKIEDEALLRNFGYFGLGGVVGWYHGLEDKDQARREKLSQDQMRIVTETKNWLPNNTAGTLMYNQSVVIDKAKKLSPTQAEMDKEAMRDFAYYREKGMPIWLSKELTSGEQIGKGTYYGMKEAVYFNPRTIAFKTGAFATAVAGASALTTYSAGAGTLASSQLLKWGSLALTGLWAGSVIVRTSAGSTEYERGKIFGDIVGKEILPIIAGGLIGRAVGTRAIKWYENYKTMKQNPEWTASYKRVRMVVLRAEQNFPTDKTSKHLSEFQKAKFSLLTDEKGSKVKVTRKFKTVDEDLMSQGYTGLKEMSYNPRELFKVKKIVYPSADFMRVDLDKGTIRFNRIMHLSRAEKLAMLKTYFGNQYSFKLIDGQFSLTKYLPKEAWNKLGLSAGSHATTSGRFANVGERYIAGAGSSELPAQYFSSEDSLYFALGKGQSSSLYGGSILGSAVPKPYVEALRSEGFVKIPKNYHPKMTKLQVIEYLKKYAPDYPLKTISRSGAGSYWKEAEYMIQRGRTGELVVIGRKSEIEAGKLFGTVSERTAGKPYYTRVMKPEIYKDLTEISRLGQTEYIWQVKPISLKDIILVKTKQFKPLSFMGKLKIKPLTNFAKKFNFDITYPTVNPILKYRIGDILMDRRVGSFKPMKFGELVPIERYRAIPQTTLEKEQHIAGIKAIMKQFGTTKSPTKMTTFALKDNILSQKIRQVADMGIPSSRRLPKSAISYAEEYASMISFPKRSYTSPSASYSKSSSSLMSSIRSLISSDMSSGSRMRSSPSMSSASYLFDYWSGSSYKKSYSSMPPSYPKSSFGLGSLKEKIRRKKFKIAPEMQGLFPDFTARSIGLAPKSVSLKQAMREMNKLQTGFEVRRGARLKGFSPIDERNLMKGIMK